MEKYRCLGSIVPENSRNKLKLKTRIIIIDRKVSIIEVSCHKMDKLSNEKLSDQSKRKSNFSNTVMKGRETGRSRDIDDCSFKQADLRNGPRLATAGDSTGSSPT